MTPAGFRPGQRGEIHRRLGVAGALQHAARPVRTAGKCGPGWTSSSDRVAGIGQQPDGAGAVKGADAGRDALRGVHRHREGRAVRLAVLLHHRD